MIQLIPLNSTKKRDRGCELRPKIEFICGYFIGRAKDQTKSSTFLFQIHHRSSNFRLRSKTAVSNTPTRTPEFPHLCVSNNLRRHVATNRNKWSSYRKGQRVIVRADSQKYLVPKPYISYPLPDIVKDFILLRKGYERKSSCLNFLPLPSSN